MSATDPADRPEDLPAAAPAGGRKRPLSQRQQNLKAKAHEIKAAIIALVMEFNARLPRDRAESVGAIYARYSTSDQQSVPDQVRRMLEYAERERIYVPLENVFYDLGEKGYRRGRPGILAMTEAHDRGAFTTLLLFATNRFFRDREKSIEFVERHIVAKGHRAVFVTNGLDTKNTKQWKRNLQFHGFLDEMVVGLYSESIQAVNEGLLLKGFVYSTIPLGYKGVPIDGVLTRKGRPRRQLAIDEDMSKWVIKIFTWFVVERLCRLEIVRRLNDDPEAPRPRLGGRWRLKTLTALLKNPRYRGEWSYGVAETRWLKDKDYARQFPRKAPLKTEQLEHLRIIPDDIFYQAQVLIAAEKSARAGRTPKDGDTASRPRELHKLFFCPTHNKPLSVGGVSGSRLLCPDCRATTADHRPLFSLLCRKTARRRLCEFLAARIRADADLVGRVVATCLARVAQLQAGDPEVFARLEAEVARITRQIDFVVKHAGDPDADPEESDRQLRQFRADRQRVTAELAALKAARARVQAVPTPEQVTAEIDRLADVLVRAASSVRPGEAAKVRQIIDLLTGGRIDLEQVGERRAYGGFLRGRFRLRLVDAVSDQFLGSYPGSGADSGEEVTIDFDKSHKRIGPKVRDRVMELYHQNWLIRQISDETGVSRKAVWEIVAAWHAERGLSVPNSYERRKANPVKQVAPTKAMLLADAVYAAITAGQTVAAVAEANGISEPTVYAAWKTWFASRGQTAPSIREWRKAGGTNSGSGSDLTPVPDSLTGPPPRAA
jgi:DNA invertase Pin-like site-specific DNA recombinase